MKAVFRFLASAAGRWVRAIAGIVLIVAGLALVQGTGGWILAIVGLLPLAAGMFDRCLFAPLFGLPFVGSALRKAVEK
jgi:hypothetical protein